MPFAHLHVASSSSMRYGASFPAELVAAAVADGQGILGLTDRDGLYGSVRFVRAAVAAGVAPVIGVDLALDLTATRPLLPTVPGGGAPAGGRDGRGGPFPGSVGTRAPRTPVRGGAFVDDRASRVVVLARGTGAGVAPGRGWAALCRLVTAAHLSGVERGRPAVTPRMLADAVAGPRDGGPSPLLVLLGPDSDVGRTILDRPDRARELLLRWRALLGEALVVEATCHDAPPGQVRSASQARRLLRLAREVGVPCVLTAAVRHAGPEGAPIVDVLDAARRLTVLDDRHLDRVSTAGHLASTATMAAIAERLTGDTHQARALLDVTAAVAAECVQHPRHDIGLGSVHLPEPDVLGLAPGEDPQRVLAERCRAGVTRCYPHAREADLARITARLDDELDVVASLGYATYFLTVALVCDLVRGAGVRVAARGSGAGSLVNHLLGISGVDPFPHGLLMERFCTPLRAQLPDIDVDVEAARRTETYELILDHFGGERVTCVSMTETYRVRHAIRDVGSALGLPAVEIDAIAKAFPHIRAHDARTAIAELPELAGMGLTAPRMEVLFDLVERLDGLPRHLALHPCGIVLSGLGLLDRTPVEASGLGFPMSQFDKDDVEALGLLKLDVLGVRMQSAMAYATAEIARVEGTHVDLDDRDCVPLDDPSTFELVRSTRTLGCFQIESPGQRELVGRFAPETFEDLVVDISLFRPGPVKSDMITPFLRARQGWAEPEYLHPSLEPALAETWGVVVFHEQVLRILVTTSGISLAEADEVRRALGTHEGREEVETWWREAAAARGYSPADRDRIWKVLAAFASFGFCKAHAAAFALPTYQSAWLKAHHPAAFLAGVLTHDPGMYPKRLILDDARTHGIPILGLDVNASGDTYRVERGEDEVLGIRVSLADVKGISDDEVARIVAGRPYAGLEDLARRARPSRPVLERLVLAGALDELYGIDVASRGGLGRRGALTRRDLLLHVAELDRWNRADARGRARGGARYDSAVHRGGDARGAGEGGDRRDDRGLTGVGTGRRGEAGRVFDVRSRAAGQSRGAAPVASAGARSVQLALDIGPEPTPASGLPELGPAERVQAELDILGLDVSAHVLEPYAEMFDDLGIVRARDLREVRTRSDILVAGVKVATQTPPVRSGRRVVFLTLDDATGPVDAAFFEDVQGACAMTVFHHWLLVVRGVTRRTGPRGVSIRATAAHDLLEVWDAWSTGGVEAARAVMTPATVTTDAAGSAGARLRPTRVLRHASGFTQSPYADIAPAGTPARQSRALAALATGWAQPSRPLWHTSPGSAGR
ncbi:DNA polymerase III subunit alpha [Mobilicoccus pelagius]|uniref:DNA-directed DNA polymerase n=1 Tax=Mobilicoccus pelagius NBRC 104925 TaxID=1089455 RepID=H5UUR4_9MICO|nr:DNA polymerase III subunit alpha [Mobilicoccus pelagius]GAB49472.1 error-prone DNA polymerase [Mobilicoccus pelagius NBRC 104925]